MARPALSFWITRRDLVGSFFGQHWLAAWRILRVRQVPARLVKSRLALLRSARKTCTVAANTFWAAPAGR